jgi:UDP-N-acetylmuramoyl-tripeptide--D-alanyl-D-alanine ligase
MIRASLSQIAAMIPGAEADAAHRDVQVAGVGRDTREPLAGRLFIPLAGERFDGHDFAGDARRLGAAATLWQRDRGAPPSGLPAVLVDDTLEALQQLAAAYRRRLGVKVIGVTGSNGKTSTKDMIHAALSAARRVHKTKGNLNNHIGLPFTILEMAEDAEFAVLEMGMSGTGEIAALSNIAAPDVAVITNVGEAHLMQLGSREAIARAKFEIISGLVPGGALVWHGDEPLLDALVREHDERLPAARIRFGAGHGNDYYPDHVEISLTGSRFTAVPRSGAAIRDLSVPLPGRHNVLNALAAVAVARLFGVPDDRIREGLSGMQPTGMRSETVRAASGATLINDAYNASPTSMKAALTLLGELPCGGWKIAVLGDMLELGEAGGRLHREIGDFLSPGVVDFVLTYGDLAAYIAEECLPRFADGRVEAFRDKTLLAERLKRLAGPGDLVLFKASRGMRLEEVIQALV